MPWTLDDLAPAREVTRWSGKKNEGTSGQVYSLIVHGSVGMTDPVDLAEWMNGSINASYNAITDGQTLVYQVPRSDTAWHARRANGRADGICLTTTTDGYSPDEWLGEQFDKLRVGAWWIALVAADRQVDIGWCSRANIVDALSGNRAAGGVYMHKDYTYASEGWLGYRDGSHVDVRGLDEPAGDGRVPMRVMLRMAAEAAGYTDWQTRDDEPPPQPPEDGMALTDEEISRIARAVWLDPATDVIPVGPESNPHLRPPWAFRNLNIAVNANRAAVEQLATLLAERQQLDVDTVKQAVRDAIADAVVQVDVDVTGGGA